MTINLLKTLSSSFWNCQHSSQSTSSTINFWFNQNLNRFNQNLNRKSSSLSMSKKFIFLKITTMMIITTTMNRFFIIAKKNILSHSSKHSLLLMNRSTRTLLLFYSHLMRQFWITKSFNITLSHSSSRINQSSHLSHLMLSFLIKSTTRLFRSSKTIQYQSTSIIRFQSQYLMTSTIILQSISINLFYSAFSKTLMKNYRFFFQKRNHV